MKKQDLARMYANHFGTTLVAAEKVIRNFAILLEDCVAMGETAILPGTLTVGVKLSNPRKVYDFTTGSTRITDPKPVPFVKIGKKLKEAALTAPLLD